LEEGTENGKRGKWKGENRNWRKFVVRGQRSVDREGRKGGNLFSDEVGRGVGVFRPSRNLLDQIEVGRLSSKGMVTEKVLTVKDN